MFRYTSEIVHAFRIPCRNSSSPLIKFTTTARHNELIARARRRGQLNASNVASSRLIGFLFTNVLSGALLLRLVDWQRCMMGHIWEDYIFSHQG